MTWAALPVSEYKTRGDRLRALRDDAGLVREDVATKTGVRGQTIYRYETGEIEEVGGDALLALAALYRTDPRWIMHGDPRDPDRMAAFADFETRIAPTLRPPMGLGERGHLVWARMHHPSPEKFLRELLDAREGESPADAAASEAATGAAKAKGAAMGAKAATIKRGRR